MRLDVMHEGLNPAAPVQALRDYADERDAAQAHVRPPQQRYNQEGSLKLDVGIETRSPSQPLFGLLKYFT